MVIRTEQLLTTADAAARIRSARTGRPISTRRVLQLVEAGTLRAIELSDGQNVFRAEDVEQCSRQRQRVGGAA